MFGDIHMNVYQRGEGYVVDNSPWFPGEVKYCTLAEKSSIICRNRSPLWKPKLTKLENGTFDINNEINHRCLYGGIHAQNTTIMSHSIHIGMPYVVHNEIQYIHMRGRVVRKKTAFFASIFGLTTIKQAYIPPPPHTSNHHHTSQDDHLFSYN